MEYYRTYIKTKKWTLKILIHFLDLAIVNAWRAYKIDCEANKFPSWKILDLLDFRLELQEMLIKIPKKRRCTESFNGVSDDEMPVMPRKYQKAAKPPVPLIYDGYDHLPEFDDIKSPRACQYALGPRPVALNAMCIFEFHVDKIVLNNSTQSKCVNIFF